MSKMLVLHYNHYSFVDKETGERIEGQNCMVIDPEQPAGPGGHGYPVTKVNVPAHLAHEFVEAPAFYDLTYSIRPGAGGKPSVRLATAKLLSAIELVKVPKAV